MTDVTVEYCVPCGFRAQALTVQRQLLDRFGRDLDSVALEPGHGGVFRVAVDGETVWDKDVHGMDPDVDAIAEAVETTDGGVAAEGNA